MNINDIAKLTKKLSRARAELGDIITTLQLKQNAALHQALPEIRKIVGKTADYSGQLFTGIDASRELFVDPKSQIINGIKVGLRKGTGGITWDDEAAVIARAEKKLSAEQCDLIIKTEKTLRKKALAGLDGGDLKAIGCTIEDTGDVVIVKPVDTAVDKLVNSILKKAIDEAQKEAA